MTEVTPSLTAPGYGAGVDILRACEPVTKPQTSPP